MGWLIFCAFIEDFVLDVQYKDFESPESTHEAFMTYYSLLDKSNIQVAIIVTYYAFTSLSTVGFGDYHPTCSEERIVGAFMLLMGVAIFSYIMGNFIDILNQF